MKVDTPRTVGLAVLALCLVQFVDVLGVTVVVTALPAMLTDLRAPADAASLISAGYAMFFGGLLMTGARLGDRFGHRRIILAGLLVFAVAAVIGATAASAAVLTAARCLQGAAAALSVPPALRLLTTITADGPQRRMAIAWWSAAGRLWALPACVAAGGAGIGLSSVAATGLGTDVPAAARGTAAGIINTAAQLGTALGVAVLLLVAALTTGIPGPARPVPAVAWGLAAAISLAGAVLFMRRDRPDAATAEILRPARGSRSANNLRK